MLNKELSVQECDATKAYSSIVAGYIISLITIIYHLSTIIYL